MAVFSAPWKTNPIQYLVHERFPILAAYPGPLENPHYSDDIKTQLRKANEQASAFRKELAELGLEGIQQLAAEARKREIEKYQEKQREEEQARFFNQPSSNADFEYWAKMSYWTIDEAVALSFGKDPRVVSWERLKSLVNVSAFAKKYDAKQVLVSRAETMGQLYKSTVPHIFLAWARRMQFDMPHELVATVEGLGIQISDWKTLFDQKDELFQKVQSQLAEERASRLADLKKHSEYLSEISDGHSKQIADYARIIDQYKSMHDSLSARIVELESVPPTTSEKRLGARERESLLRLIIAMAIDGYGYDPKAGRSPTAKELSDHTLRLGLPLSDDTIRSYLNEAKELLAGITE
jgi:DNA repair exonuclease SbcCD ATPase subunit